MYILGISAFYHDSSASLILNGEIIAAAQEERFTRKKHDQSFPINSIKYCLLEASISAEEIEKVVFYEKPFLKFERLLETYLAFAPFGFKSFLSSMPLWIKEKLFQKSIIIKSLSNKFGSHVDWEKKIMFSEHHLSHLASAYYPSPFNDSALLSLDGVGEWTTSSYGVGEGKNIKILKEIYFPHSLGLLYSAFTSYLGFKVNSGEYKLMGLAPYGVPKYANKIKKYLIDIKDDGSFHLNIKYFNYCTGVTMTNKKFNLLFEGPPRVPESQITQRDMDLAASIQKVIEEIVLKIGITLSKETNKKNLCLAGGVALNCVANSILKKNNIFKNIWVQPAAGDAGCSLGAALAVWYMHFKKNLPNKNNRDCMKGSYLGPQFTDENINKTLEKNNIIFSEYNKDKDFNEKLIDEIIKGKAIGWFQGRMEFGPRSLGSRSILADPRSENMQKKLNLKIKFRESFRPFAPSILIDKVSDWFDYKGDSPYMVFVATSKKMRPEKINSTENPLRQFDKLQNLNSLVPAVTHIDHTSRIQTVDQITNKKYFNLIKTFYEKTNCPMLVNTSFNIRGEPIVCTPQDAYECFMNTGLDFLAIGKFIIDKKLQKVQNFNVNKRLFDLD